MSMPEEYREIAQDLGNKVTTDTIETVMRTINLCDDATQKLFVAMNAATATGSIMACSLGEREMLDRPATVLADATLFALMFAWMCRDPHHNDHKTKDVVVRAKMAWEAVTGREFDPSWLRKEMRKHLAQS